MPKKRKSESSALNEIDRTIYPSFRGAASSLSQFFSQSVNQQKLAFQAGERHGMEKLYEWMIAKERDEAGLAETDVVTYLQSYIESTESVTGSGSQTEQSEKKAASPVRQQHMEHHKKESANLINPLESDMDIS